MKNHPIIEKNLFYTEFKPCEELSKFIQSFWTIKNIVSDEQITILPDGCFDIVIYIKKNKNEIKLTGIWDKIIKVDKYKGFDIVGVRFYPKALNKFFNINIAKIKNKTIEFHKDLVKQVKEMDLKILYELKSINEIIEYFNIYFLILSNLITEKTIFEIDFNNIDTVNSLAQKSYMSERQYLRIFNEKLGISPKKYLNILRFLKAKKSLISGQKIIDIVYSCGYADQSHFIKEFKKYTNLTPIQFLNRV